MGNETQCLFKNCVSKCSLPTNSDCIKEVFRKRFTRAKIKFNKLVYQFTIIQDLNNFVPKEKKKDS